MIDFLVENEKVDRKAILNLHINWLKSRRSNCYVKVDSAELFF